MNQAIQFFEKMAVSGKIDRAIEQKFPKLGRTSLGKRGKCRESVDLAGIHREQRANKLRPSRGSGFYVQVMEMIFYRRRGNK